MALGNHCTPRRFGYGRFRCNSVARGIIKDAMAFKIFLSYSTDPEENPIVWRLQTLAASHGIHMYVPQRSEPGLTGSRRKAIILPDGRFRAGY